MLTLVGRAGAVSSRHYFRYCDRSMLLRSYPGVQSQLRVLHEPRDQACLRRQAVTTVILESIHKAHQRSPEAKHHLTFNRVGGRRTWDDESSKLAMTGKASKCN